VASGTPLRPPSGRSTPPRVAASAVAFLVLVAIAACGGDDDPVAFGEGEVPPGVPADFPVPPDGAIGATLVDTPNHRVEFTVTVDTDLPSLVQFFTFGLVSAGYIVEQSHSLNQTTWEIAFNREELTGTVLVSSDGGSMSQAVVSLDLN